MLKTAKILLQAILLLSAISLVKCVTALKNAQDKEICKIMEDQNRLVHTLENITKGKMYIEKIENNKTHPELRFYVSLVKEDRVIFEQSECQNIVNDFLTFNTRGKISGEKSCMVVFKIRRSISDFKKRIAKEGPDSEPMQLVETVRYLVDEMKKKKEHGALGEVIVRIDSSDYFTTFLIDVVEMFHEVKCAVYFRKVNLWPNDSPKYMNKDENLVYPAPENKLQYPKKRQDIDIFQKYEFSADISIDPEHQQRTLDALTFGKRISFERDIEILPAALFRLLNSDVFTDKTQIIVNFSNPFMAEARKHAYLEIPLYSSRSTSSRIEKLNVNIGHGISTLHVAVAEDNENSPLSLQRTILIGYIKEYGTKKALLAAQKPIARHAFLVEDLENIKTAVGVLSINILEKDIEAIEICEYVAIERVEIVGYIVEVLKNSCVFTGTLDSVVDIFDCRDAVTFELHIYEYIEMVAGRFRKTREEVRADLALHGVIVGPNLERIGNTKNVTILRKKEDPTPPALQTEQEESSADEIESAAESADQVDATMD